MDETALNKIRRSLEQKHKEVVKSFHKKHKAFIKHAGYKGASAFSGLLLSAASPIPNLPSTTPSVEIIQNYEKQNSTFTPILSDVYDEKYKTMVDFLKGNPNKLTVEDEKFIERELSSKFNLDLRVSIEGKRLNDIWGYFGQEQHLYRWPGDNLASHGDYLKYGIAPATGSFGYFEDAQQERYYIAAQMHLIPTWNTDWPVLKPFFKFKKVLVYNPSNQKAVVAVIGDNGPALWTGKKFGGSPELMNFLQMKDGRARSKAVVLLINDPSDSIALGPISTAKFNQLAFNSNLINK